MKSLYRTCNNYVLAAAFRKDDTLIDVDTQKCQILKNGKKHYMTQ